MSPNSYFTPLSRFLRLFTFICSVAASFNSFGQQKTLVFNLPEIPQLVVSHTPLVEFEVGESLNLGDYYRVENGSGSYTFKWVPAAGLSNVTVRNPQLTPVDEIKYTLTISDQVTGCTTDVSFSLQDHIITGTLNEVSDAVTVFPNPSDGLLYIRSHTPASIRYDVYNVLGQVVESGAGFHEIELKIESKGVFTASIRVGENQVFKKIIIR